MELSRSVVKIVSRPYDVHRVLFGYYALPSSLTKFYMLLSYLFHLRIPMTVIRNFTRRHWYAQKFHDEVKESVALCVPPLMAGKLPIFLLALERLC